MRRWERAVPWLAGVSAALLAVACGSSATGSPDGDRAEEETVVDADLPVDGDPDADGEMLADGDGQDESESESEAADEEPATDGEPDAELDPEPDGEPEPDGDTSAWIVPPATACSPAGDACQIGDPVETIYASYRKDHWLPDSIYPEYTDPPVDGGRFQIAAVSAVTGSVTEVWLNGRNLTELTGTSPEVEWWHVWPYRVTAGEPVWFAFHSRKPAWDGAQGGELRIVTDNGEAVNGAFPVAQSKPRITYVTTADDRSTLLIHVRNQDLAARTVQRVVVNGRDVLAADAICVPERRLEPGEHALWSMPLCRPLDPGAAWTVAIEWDAGPPSVGAGRVVPERFVIESWAASDDCPLPGANEETFQVHRQLGVDTIHAGWEIPGNCGADPIEVFGRLLPALGDYFVLMASDHIVDHPVLPTTAGLAGFLTGDESDGEIYDDDGRPNPENKARMSRRAWQAYPELPTYNGSKTNGNVGTFTGIADIHGMDVYIAACAPHITQWGSGTPIRMPYDYFMNVRNNHMPLPSWFYAQGLGSMWNGNQPNRQEVIVQGWEVAAAGGKGLMWFQTRQSLAGDHPEVMQAMTEVNWMYRGVREFLREGDPTGGADGGPEVLAELIRSRQALVVPLISLKSSSGPNDITCLAAGIGLAPHWVWAPHAPALRIAVPDDFGVAEMFELGFRQTFDVTSGFTVAGRTITFPAVPLDNARPVRILVLAADPGVRGRVEAAMQP